MNDFGHPIIAIVGDRRIDPILHRPLLQRVVVPIIIDRECDHVITGDALGVDAFARWYGQDPVLTLTVYTADDERAEFLRQESYQQIERVSDWKRHGKSAGPLRNARMARDADEAIIIDGGGPGSANVRAQFEAAKKRVHHFIIDDCYCANVSDDERPSQMRDGHDCSHGIIIHPADDARPL